MLPRVSLQDRDAIGLGQGEVDRVDPTLRLQVQNYAAHGTVGVFLFFMPELELTADFLGGNFLQG